MDSLLGKGRRLLSLRQQQHKQRTSLIIIIIIKWRGAGEEKKDRGKEGAVRVMSEYLCKYSITATTITTTTSITSTATHGPPYVTLNSQ